jgi:uncharacterized protein (UPF0332 family)
MTPFARALVRKSERALKTARIALSSGDFDNAVNRSFYSMFDIARAALLEAGVAEDKLKGKGPILVTTPIARPEMIKVIQLTTISMNSLLAAFG